MNRSRIGEAEIECNGEDNAGHDRHKIKGKVYIDIQGRA